jgi:hypothetical protein
MAQQNGRWMHIQNGPSVSDMVDSLKEIGGQYRKPVTFSISSEAAGLVKINTKAYVDAMKRVDNGTTFEYEATTESGKKVNGHFNVQVRKGLMFIPN